MKKLLALLSLFVLLFTSSAGCIDIYLFNEWLVPQEDEEIEYEDVEVLVASHTFNSTINIFSFNIDDLIEHHKVNATVSIPEGTAGLRFNIYVQMRSAQDIWEDLNETLNGTINGTLYNLLASLVEGLYDNRTRISMEDEVRLAKADPGEWSVVVEGDGVGFDFSQYFEDLKLEDSFTITAVIRQPK
jgi:hypothetical protein